MRKLFGIARMHLGVKKSWRSFSPISWSKKCQSLRSNKRDANGFSFVVLNAYAVRFSGCSACTIFIFQKSSSNCPFSILWLSELLNLASREWYVRRKFSLPQANLHKCKPISRSLNDANDGKWMACSFRSKVEEKKELKLNPQLRFSHILFKQLLELSQSIDLPEAACVRRFGTAQMQTKFNKTCKEIRCDLQFVEVFFKRASCALKVASG